MREHHHRGTARDAMLCRCGAMLCWCCVGDSSPHLAKGVKCTLCHGDCWFVLGEYSDATTPVGEKIVRVKPGRR